MPQLTTPERELDHNNECVGCGAHQYAPCDPTCPFETGTFGPGVLLRACARRVGQHRAGVGYSVSAALFAAAQDLTGEAEAHVAHQRAHQVLAQFLRRQGNGSLSGNELVYRLGLFADTDHIGMQLYAAAADHDGITFDPESFGDTSS